MADDEVVQGLLRHLISKNWTPAHEWWLALLPTLRLSLPLISLQKTAEYKIIASDITQSLDANKTASLPANALDATVKDQPITQPIITQILDIEDISRSRWSQIELLEQQERGEMTRGREIIRVIEDEDRQTTPTADTTRGPHKLLLQDVKGTKIYAFEMTPVTGLGSKTEIGAKLVIRQASIARGLLLLDGRHVEYLGGKVGVWHDQWIAERKQTLKSRLSQQ